MRTPIVNGGARDYTEWLIKDLGGVLTGTTRCFVMAGVSTYDNGVRRVQSDYAVHGSVFEDAQNVGLVADGLGANWGFYDNGHGHITDSGMTLKMDGGSDLKNMPVNVPILGSSLVIEQNFNIRLPKNDSTGTGTMIGTVLRDHTFDVNGCKVIHTHTITAVGIGNQNSYGMMFPLTGCNRAQFGANAALDITPVNSGQGSSQGQQSTIQAWHTDRPDLIAELILPTGNPGSADGWTKVTTSDTFIINNTGYSKIYVNSRSGSSAIAAAATDTHTAQYRMRKT